MSLRQYVCPFDVCESVYDDACICAYLFSCNTLWVDASIYIYCVLVLCDMFVLHVYVKIIHSTHMHPCVRAVLARPFLYVSSVVAAT